MATIYNIQNEVKFSLIDHPFTKTANFTNSPKTPTCILARLAEGLGHVFAHKVECVCVGDEWEEQLLLVLKAVENSNHFFLPENSSSSSSSGEVTEMT